MTRKRKAKGKGKPVAKGGAMPGIIQSWEDFDEASMREYLDTLARELSDELDKQEQSFRSRN